MPILEMGGSICAVDKNWRKDKNGCFVDADEWTQVKRRGVFVSPHLEHLNADMLPSQEWACAPQRKTSQVFRNDRDIQSPPGLTMGDFIKAAENRKYQQVKIEKEKGADACTRR